MGAAFSWVVLWMQGRTWSAVFLEKTLSVPHPSGSWVLLSLFQPQLSKGSPLVMSTNFLKGLVGWVWLFFLIMNLIFPFTFIPDFHIHPPAYGRPTSHTYAPVSHSCRQGCQAGCWRRSTQPGVQCVFLSCLPYGCSQFCFATAMPVVTTSPTQCLPWTYHCMAGTSPTAGFWRWWSEELGREVHAQGKHVELYQTEPPFAAARRRVEWGMKYNFMVINLQRSL